MKRKCHLKTFFAFVTLISTACLVDGAGVTVITHGWIHSGFEVTSSGRPAWIDNMAKAIGEAASREGLKTSLYNLHVTADWTRSQGTLSRVSTLSASGSENVVVTVDWSDIADHTAWS